MAPPSSWFRAVLKDIHPMYVAGLAITGAFAFGISLGATSSARWELPEANAAAITTLQVEVGKVRTAIEREAEVRAVADKLLGDSIIASNARILRVMCALAAERSVTALRDCTLR